MQINAMKKTLLACVCVLFLLSITSCKKERTCRCSVLGQQTIRVIKIERGSCDDMRYVVYDVDPVLRPNITDSILCTDYDFD